MVKVGTSVTKDVQRENLRAKAGVGPQETSNKIHKEGLSAFQQEPPTALVRRPRGQS